MHFISLEEKIFMWAEKAPKKIALVDKGKSITYQELIENIWATKSVLETDYLIAKEDNVILAANNNIHFIYAYFAIHLLGARAIPLDEQTQIERISLIVNETKPKLIIGLKLENVSNCCNFDEFKYIKHKVIPNQIDFPEFDQIADILFTTGTTGSPKGVILTHGNITSSAVNINTFIENNSNDIELLALPVSHSFGLGRIKCVLSVGGTLVLLGSIVNIKRMFRTFEEHKITGFGMVPASWEYIQKMSGTRLADFAGQLNYIELGSAYMSPKDKQALLDLFPMTRICMHYGLTEASRSTFTEFLSDINHLGSIGKASPNVEIKIKDGFGRTKNLGGEGEICIWGNHVTKGYINLPKTDFFYGEYFRTGDIGSMDSQGYVYIKGRYKEIINVGGKKLSPIEVESKIHEFDPLLESACIGIKDPEGILGEVVKVFIVKNNSTTKFGDIDGFLKSKLESYKIPVEYEWIDEIPKTKSGKMQRQKLV